MAPLKYQLIVIGGSAGAIAALLELLPVFPPDYPLPIVIVQHLHPLQDRHFTEPFADQCALTVKEADDKEPITAGYVYFAPANYHLLIEEDKTFSFLANHRPNPAQ